ncbi:MAG TPA: DnaJ domain-containing protein [Casimicrobiaceae bacterium]
MNYTHYDYLELPPGATPARVEAAYAKLTARFEEAAGEQDFAGLVRLIHAAYAVLRDDEARKAYDQALADEAARADVELKSDLDSQAPKPFRRVQAVPQPLNAAFSSLAA